MDSEAKLHEYVERLRGEWAIKTDWGKIIVTFRPFRVGYGTKKGTPDELLIIKVVFPLFGEEASLQLPVLLEMEEKSGMSASLEDLEKFLKGMLSGREKDIYYKYTEIPMFVLGKKRKEKIKEILLRTKIKIKEISRNI